MVKSVYYRQPIKQLFLNYICPAHIDWLFFSYWVSSLIPSSLLIMRYTSFSFWAYLRSPVCWCFKMPCKGGGGGEKGPSDLLHCLFQQLQFTLLINFDVKTNEIRQVIKAEPDRHLIYTAFAIGEWQKLMKMYLTASLAKAEFRFSSASAFASYSSVYLNHVKISLIMKTLHLNRQMFTLK